MKNLKFIDYLFGSKRDFINSLIKEPTSRGICEMVQLHEEDLLSWLKTDSVLAAALEQEGLSDQLYADFPIFRPFLLER